MGFSRRWWNTEPLWAWRIAVVFWWMFVVGAMVSLASAALSILLRP